MDKEMWFYAYLSHIADFLVRRIRRIIERDRTVELHPVVRHVIDRTRGGRRSVQGCAGGDGARRLVHKLVVTVLVFPISPWKSGISLG